MTKVTISKILTDNIYLSMGFLIYLLIGSLILFFTSHESVVLWLNQYHHPYPNEVVRYLTHLGDGLFCLFVVLVFLFIRYYYALMLLASFAVTSVIVQSLKFLINAPRPRLYLGAEAANLNFVEGVAVHSHHSFPSGHSAIAFLMFCMLALYSKNKQAGVLLLMLAIVVSLTRSYLVQHFFIDTYAGAVIGTTVSLLTYYVFENYTLLQQNKLIHQSLMNRIKKSAAS